MQLRTAQIVGFQSFEDTGAIEFGEGINLVVGQNNAGKSALLRALLAAMPNDAHRSPKEHRKEALPQPKTLFTIQISGAELIDGVISSGSQWVFPAPSRPQIDPVEYILELLKLDCLDFEVSRRWDGGFVSETYPSHRKFEVSGSGSETAGAVRIVDGNLQVLRHNNSDDTIPTLLYQIWERNVFYFSAERYSLGHGQVHHVRRLDQNASNLAAVLNTLQSDSGDLFERLQVHLREIFPTVGKLSIRVRTNEPVFEVHVWPTREQQRPELSFRLEHSGTGVAQMIALLTAGMR